VRCIFSIELTVDDNGEREKAGVLRITVLDLDACQK
jgi:hypothetical protein